MPELREERGAEGQAAASPGHCPRPRGGRGRAAEARHGGGGGQVHCAL